MANFAVNHAVSNPDRKVATFGDAWLQPPLNASRSTRCHPILTQA